MVQFAVKEVTFRCPERIQFKETKEGKEMNKLMVGMVLAALEAAGTIGGFFCPVPGVGLVADCLSAGMIAVECRARDSGTGKIVGMFADTESEPSELLQFSKYTYTSGAKISLKKLAEDVAKAAATRVEERAALRRDFPVEFIALPWENDLDKKVKGMFE